MPNTRQSVLVKGRMSRKKSRSKSKAILEQESLVILDVELHFSAYVVQHVAVPDGRPLSEWKNFDAVIDAAGKVEHLLPRRGAIHLSNVTWMDRQLSFGVIGDDGDCPYLHVTISGCPSDKAIQLMPPENIAHMMSVVHEPLRGASVRKPEGPAPEPGTMINPYERFEEWRSDEPGARLDKFESYAARKKFAAMNAARRAASLPLLPRTATIGAA